MKCNMRLQNPRAPAHQTINKTGGVEMDRTNQIWSDKRKQILFERLSEALSRIQKNQEVLCSDLEEVNLILHTIDSIDKE